jgi:hypothetical protein
MDEKNRQSVKSCPLCNGRGVITKKKFSDLYQKEVDYSVPCSCLRRNALHHYLKPLRVRCGRYGSENSRKNFLGLVKMFRGWSREGDIRTHLLAEVPNVGAGYLICMALFQFYLEDGKLLDMPDYKIVSDVEVKDFYCSELHSYDKKKIEEARILIIDIGAHPQGSQGQQRGFSLAFSDLLTKWTNQGKWLWLISHGGDLEKSDVASEGFLKLIENRNCFMRLDTRD